MTSDSKNFEIISEAEIANYAKIAKEKYEINDQEVESTIQSTKTNSAEINLPFDENGAIASTGVLDEKLFDQQYKINFFKEYYPKSLSNQWVQENQTAIFLENKNKTENKLFTIFMKNTGTFHQFSIRRMVNVKMGRFSHNSKLLVSGCI